MSKHHSFTSHSFLQYAYVNHWFSLYVGPNYKYPAVQMHELGHNLNMAHSGGKDGKTYTDHTCLMGNPLWTDHQVGMCFNPVKNYQIAAGKKSWYNSEHIVEFNTGTLHRQSWSGKLIGVAEYDNNPENHPIVLKLETGSASDWFIGFNRDTGPNRDTQQAGDEVTIYKVAQGDGVGYSHSFLKGNLVAGKRAKITSWRDTGKDLIIEVKDINTSASPGWAEVEITFEGTPAPGGSGGSPATRSPTSSVRSSKYSA